MKVTMEAIGPCKKLLRIEVGLEQVKQEIEKHMKEMRAHAQLPGFRRGHAPKALLEKRVGAQVLEEAREHLVSESYHEAVTQEKLDPLGDPVLDKMDFDPAKGLSYEVTLEVRPEFELVPTQDIPLVRQAIRITDADLDASLLDLRRQRAEWIPAPAGTALKKGDLAFCDLSLLDGERKLWGQEKVGIVLNEQPLGELPTGPADKLLEGYKAGETCRVVATLPENFSRQDLRGKMATVSVAVQEVRHEQLPEADDELAGTLGLANVGELRESLRGHVQRHKEAAAHRKLEEDLVSHLIAKTSFELPQGILQAHAEDALKRTTVDLLMRGIPEQQVHENLEKLKTGTKEGAERRLRATLILARIAEREKVFVTESDVEDRIRQMAASYGERPEGIRKKLEREGGMGALRASIREGKVIDLLLARAMITKAP